MNIWLKKAIEHDIFNRAGFYRTYADFAINPQFHILQRHTAAAFWSLDYKDRYAFAPYGNGEFVYLYFENNATLAAKTEEITEEIRQIHPYFAELASSGFSLEDTWGEIVTYMEARISQDESLEAAVRNVKPLAIYQDIYRDTSISYYPLAGYICCKRAEYLLVDGEEREVTTYKPMSIEFYMNYCRWSQSGTYQKVSGRD